MKHIRNLRLAGVILGAAILAVSCSKASLGNKNNPVTASLPAADFEITMLDYERGYDRDSNYVFEGVWENDAFLFGVYKTEKMVPNITPDNGITFRITSDSPSFQGVNASSSKACINIVQDGHDHTVYHLEWAAEGESTITFWNGDGATKKQVSFTATSKKVIPLEGFKYRTRRDEFMFKKYYADYYEWGLGGSIIAPPASHHEWRFDYDAAEKTMSPDWNNAGCNAYDKDWGRMDPVEIYPVPLNATATDQPLILVLGYSCVTPNGHIEDEEVDKLNTANYSQFRWFNPKQRKPKEYSISSKNTDAEAKQIWAEAYENNLNVYPSDLRERRIKLFYYGSAGRLDFRIMLFCGNLFDFEQKSMTEYKLSWSR